MPNSVFRTDTSTRFRFAVNWRVTVFSFVLFPILIGLGFWQLQRGEDKQERLDDWAAQQGSEALDITSFKPLKLMPFQRVAFNARFMPSKYWLLEGRIYKGRSGYEVLIPARLESGEVVLINRGWVPANQDRRIFPEIDTITAAQKFWGEVRQPTQTALINEHENTAVQWPHRILEMNLLLMSEQLSESITPYVVALDMDHPSAFIVQKAAINMPPEKHHGYAVQWFSMAVALLVLWLITNTNLVELLRGKKRE